VFHLVVAQVLYKSGAYLCQVGRLKIMLTLKCTLAIKVYV